MERIMETNISGNTYVVTGATSGIGLAAARLLIQAGASVIGVGRSLERCRETERMLHSLRPAGPMAAAGQQAVVLTADLSLQREVRRLAEEIGKQCAAWGKPALDGLVNNAGTFTYWMTLTAEGVETQWAVNHLAPFLLTCRLLPLLEAAPAGRVLTVSSDSHTSGRLDWTDVQLRRRYNGLQAYSNTKLANILFTLELNRRLGAGARVRAFAADPGLVKTDIGLKGTPGLARWIWKLRRSGGITAEESARGIVVLLADETIQSAPEVYWKNGRPASPARRATDATSAQRLWELSERMTGVPAAVAYAHS
jgi:NAD(P)-dependent dehydrogenase (short-subunit alcohol dehydrogenase family)